MAAPTELIVAFDYNSAEGALALFKNLKGLPIICKVGSELFTSCGPDIVKRLHGEGARVFLDLKYHDIPHTVAKAVAAASDLQVEMLTLHLSGGPLMLEAARNELKDLASRPKLIGVTVLTSFDQPTWTRVLQVFTGSTALFESVKISQSVAKFVTSGRTWGVDGVVCSAHELKPIRLLWPEVYTVVPGIRPLGAHSSDQARVMTPAEAHHVGASSIVVGRPIIHAPDPKVAAQNILKDLGYTL